MSQQLVSQASAMPTRKLTWAGVMGIFGVIIVHFMGEAALAYPFWLGWMDDTSIVAGVPVLMSWLAGYFTREWGEIPDPA